MWLIKLNRRPSLFISLVTTFKKCLTRQIFYILKDINLKFSRSDLIKSEHENFDMMSSYEEATAESEWGSTVQTDETETWDLGNPKKAWNVCIKVCSHIVLCRQAGDDHHWIHGEWISGHFPQGRTVCNEEGGEEIKKEEKQNHHWLDFTKLSQKQKNI